MILLDGHTFFRAFTGAVTMGICAAYIVPVIRGWRTGAVSDGLVMATGILMSAAAICLHVTMHVLFGNDEVSDLVHSISEAVTAAGGALILVSIVRDKTATHIVEVSPRQIALALYITGMAGALLLVRALLAPPPAVTVAPL